MIPLFRPSVGEEELESIRQSFRTGWIGYGPRIKEFETEFAKYVDAKFAVALNSATAALHLSTLALGIKPRDEVIVPSLTFVSTAHAVLYVGATPVFADVSRDTLCIDIDDVERKITDRTKAVIPVHYAGHPCDMDELTKLAREHNLTIIEDAAQATGAQYGGKKIGSISPITCFSFEAKKNLTTGEGGMITTDDETLAKKIIPLRWVGINKDTFTRFKEFNRFSWYYEVNELGYKYHMNDIQAAMGIVQLKKLDGLNDRRRQIVQRYKDELKDLDWLELPVEKKNVKSAHWSFVVKVQQRGDFIDHMKSKGVETGVHYMPVHLHPLYDGLIQKGVIQKPILPVTDTVWREIVTLPLFPSLTETDVENVVSAVKSFNPE